MASLAAQAPLTHSDGLTRILQILGDAEMRLRDVSSKKILLEVSLLNAIEARTAISLDSVLRRLQDLRGDPEGGGGTGGPAGGASVPQGGTAPATVRAADALAPSRGVASSNLSLLHEQSSPGPAEALAAPAIAVDGAAQAAGEPDLQGVWTQLLEAVGRVSPFTRTYLLEAHPVSLARNILTIGFPRQFEDHIGLVDNARNQTLLQGKLADLGQPGLQVKFVKAERPGDDSTQTVASLPATPPREPVGPPVPKGPPKAVAAGATPGPAPKDKAAPVPFNAEDFKNDPLIQKALELFKGRIVDVRA